jgi:DNA mismatch repair protein MutH
MFNEDEIIRHFNPFLGKTPSQIGSLLGEGLQQRKNKYALLTKNILGEEKGNSLSSNNIVTKTIRLNSNNTPQEAISFPAFRYNDIVEETWDSSNFKAILERRFFCVFYKKRGERFYLEKIKFWQMPDEDILACKQVWEQTVECINKGSIVNEIKNNKRSSFFPKSKDHRISHVRPHARDSNDTYPLPVADKLTGVNEYTKHSFWLNKSYIESSIFL